jgi:drug/metabolite transporter (DMT)-like permease
MGVAWGLAISLAKLAANHGGHPVGLALWQVCTSAAMMLVLSLLVGPRRRPVSGIFRFSLICGAVGVAFPAVALFWSARFLPAGVVALAFASMPMFTYLLSVLFGIEQSERRRFLGVIVGLSAIALLVLPEEVLPEPGLAPWVLLGVAASISMSIENCYAGGYRPPGASSINLSCGRQLAGIFYLTPIALFTGTAVPLLEPWGVVQWAATGAGITAGAAYTVLLHVIRTSGPVFASQTSYVITIAGVGWGMILFGERHSVYIWITLALTLAAIALVKPRQPSAVKNGGGATAT